MGTEHWRAVLATIVGRQKKLNSRCSRMAKAVTFWPWWQSFNSFCFETSFIFLLYFPLFLFATQEGLCVWSPGVTGLVAHHIYLSEQFVKQGWNQAVSWKIWNYLFLLIFCFTRFSAHKQLSLPFQPRFSWESSQFYHQSCWKVTSKTLS